MRNLIADGMNQNTLKQIREAHMMSKAELARKAGISSVTITRIETGKSCRMETKRKIIIALGMDLSKANQIFGTDST